MVPAIDALRERLASITGSAPKLDVSGPELVDPAFLELLAHLQGLVGQVFVLTVSRVDGLQTLSTVSGVLGGAGSHRNGSALFRIMIGPHVAGEFTLSPKEFQFGGFEEHAGELIASWVAGGLFFQLAGRPGTREV
jgi:hypothetical protein